MYIPVRPSVIQSTARSEQVRLLFVLCRHLPVFTQTEQVALKHGNGHLTDRGYVDGSLRSIQVNQYEQNGSTTTSRKLVCVAYLLPNIRLKVFITRDVDTNTTILQPFGLDLVILVRHSADHDIRDAKTFL